MYSLDGVALQNPTYRWRLKLNGTNPFVPISRSLVDFNASNRDGTVQVRGFTTTPTVTLVVTTPDAYLSDLKQLLRLAATLTLTADTSKALTVELVSQSAQRLTVAGGGIWQVTAVFRAPAVFWRDASLPADQGPTAITSSGQTFSLFTPSSAPIRDALICVKGSITGLVVSGANQTYFGYSPNVPTGTYLTFDSSTGRAYTGLSAFALTNEVTVNITNGRGPYFLELDGSSNPASPGLALQVAYLSASSPTLTVRGKNAYDQ